MKFNQLLDTIYQKFLPFTIYRFYRHSSGHFIYSISYLIAYNHSFYFFYSLTVLLKHGYNLSLVKMQ